jgi:glutamate 5-kinase
VRAVEGDFPAAMPVSVEDEAGRELARGLSAYDAADASRIAGHRSAEIEALLGWRGRDELFTATIWSFCWKDKGCSTLS